MPEEAHGPVAVPVSTKFMSSVMLGDGVTTSFRSMTLDTLGSESRRRRFGGEIPRRDNDPYSFGGTLSTTGIDGSRPSSRHRPVAKPEAEDDPKARPRQVIPKETRQPQFSLALDDIDGARTKVERMISHPRGTNPIDPEYKLSAYEQPVPPALKFVRDSFNVTDIRGTSAGRCWIPSRGAYGEPYPNLPPETLTAAGRIRKPDAYDNGDIEGSRPGWRPAHLARFGTAATERDTALNVKDIIEPKRKLDIQPTKVEHDIPGTFFVPRSSKPPQVSDWSLKTKDIERCQSSLRPDNDPFAGKLERAHAARRQYREINATQDIEGAVRTHQRLSTPKKKERAELRASTLAARPATDEALDAVSVSLAGAGGAELPGAEGTLRMWNAFRKTDRESSGKMSGEELTKCLNASVGLKLEPAAAQKVVSAFDKEGSGFLDYRAFTRAAAPLMGAVLTPDKPRSELALGNLAKLGTGVSVLAGVTGLPPPPRHTASAPSGEQLQLTASLERQRENQAGGGLPPGYTKVVAELQAARAAGDPPAPMAGGWDRGKKISSSDASGATANRPIGWEFFALGPADRRNRAWTPSGDPAVGLIKEEGMKQAYERNMASLATKYLGSKGAAAVRGGSARGSPAPLSAAASSRPMTAAGGDGAGGFRRTAAQPGFVRRDLMAEVAGVRALH